MPLKTYNKKEYGSGASKPKAPRDGLFAKESKMKQIETTDAEYFDMNRMQNMPMQRRGYNMMAFDYEY